MRKPPRYEKGRMTTLGNKKLSTDIGIFNLPPVKTCPNHEDCWKTCYARRAWIRYRSTRAKWNENLERTKNSEKFIADMLDEIQRTKVKTYRIHTSGDFYSDKYFSSWMEIITKSPDVKFYVYTKVEKYAKLQETEKAAGRWPSNFNIIFSFIDGFLNYGDHAWVENLVTNHNAFLCPATVKETKGKVICGQHCSYCVTNNKPVFNKH